MSNSKNLTQDKKATLFSQFAKVMELTNERKRDSNMVSKVLQGIIEGKRVEINPIITVEIESLSILDLRERYGIGENGFYDKSWWLDEDFAQDKPKPGIYEINIEKQLTNMTYSKQKQKLPEGWSFAHPAVISQAILKHYEETGQRIFNDWYTRTSLTDSDDNHVGVGGFDFIGLNIYYSCCDGNCIPNLGAVPSRKL